MRVFKPKKSRHTSLTDLIWKLYKLSTWNFKMLGPFLASVSFKYPFFFITIGSLRTISSKADPVRIDPGASLWFCRSPGPRIPQMTPQLAPSAYELTGSAWRENSRTKTPYTWRWGYFVWITPSAFPDEN